MRHLSAATASVYHSLAAATTKRAPPRTSPAARAGARCTSPPSPAPRRPHTHSAPSDATTTERAAGGDGDGNNVGDGETR